MKPDCKYEIIKSIPLIGGGQIEAGGLLSRTHGFYYLEGGLLPVEYQKDFDDMIEHEEIHGWNYLVPIVEKTAFMNSKSDL